MEAMFAEFTRRMNIGLESINERLDRVEQGNAQRRQPMRLPIRHPRDGGDYGDMEDEANQGRMVVDAQEDRYRRNSNPSNVEIKIPSFQGKSDLGAYLEWETRMEMVFQYQSYTEDKKVKLAAIEFSDYAVIWWDQLIISRRRNGE